MKLLKPEERLVRDIQNSDRAAMRRLYDQYSGYIMAIVMRYVPDRDDVADVVQDTFVRIFTSMSQYEYRGEGTLRLWLSRVTANEALGFLRRKGSITFTDNIPDSPTDDEPDVSQISDEALSEMIASLPEGYRVVLNLYVFGQMKVEVELFLLEYCLHAALVVDIVAHARLGVYTHMGQDVVLNAHCSAYRPLRAVLVCIGGNVACLHLGRYVEVGLAACGGVSMDGAVAPNLILQVEWNTDVVQTLGLYDVIAGCRTGEVGRCVGVYHARGDCGGR